MKTTLYLLYTNPTTNITLLYNNIYITVFNTKRIIYFISEKKQTNVRDILTLED